MALTEFLIRMAVQSTAKAIIRELEHLTPEERLLVMDEVQAYFCEHCGEKHPCNKAHKWDLEKQESMS